MKNREIVEKEKPASVEILHSENSTGLISGIRKRLEEQKIRESPKKSDPSEVALVSNDEYNAVVCLALARFLESAGGFLVPGTERHRAARIPAAGAVLDGAARAGEARASRRARRGRQRHVGKTLLCRQNAVLFLPLVSLGVARRPFAPLQDERRHHRRRDGARQDHHHALSPAA